MTRFAHHLGFLYVRSAGPSGTALNSAARWAALSFVPDKNRTLSTIRAYVSAVLGTVGGSDIVCDLYDNTGSGTGGAPGSSIETGKLPAATITAAGWYTFTGFTASLVAGRTYWLVFRNLHASPASNYPTFLWDVGTVGGWSIGYGRIFWGGAVSSDSGASWSAAGARSSLVVGYADGSFDGLPVTPTSAASGVGDGVYGSRESGVKFVTPANASLNVSGLGLVAAPKFGTPTGDFKLRLWTGSTPTLVAETNTIPLSAYTVFAWLHGYFQDGPVTIPPGTECRVTLAETTNSDSSSNRLNLWEVPFDTDANSLALLPWGGTLEKTYFDGSAWTDTAGRGFGHALLLDPAGEFGSP